MESASLLGMPGSVATPRNFPNDLPSGVHAQSSGRSFAFL